MIEHYEKYSSKTNLVLNAVTGKYVIPSLYFFKQGNLYKLD